MLAVAGYVVAEIARFPGAIDLDGLQFKDIPNGLAAITAIPGEKRDIFIYSCTHILTIPSRNTCYTFLFYFLSNYFASFRMVSNCSINWILGNFRMETTRGQKPRRFRIRYVNTWMYLCLHAIL
jgi:hypothetical protein